MAMLEKNLWKLIDANQHVEHVNASFDRTGRVSEASAEAVYPGPTRLTIASSAREVHRGNKAPG